MDFFSKYGYVLDPENMNRNLGIIASNLEASASEQVYMI